MSNCMLVEKPEYGGCCCRCKYRLRLMEHPPPHAMQIGWVCIALAFMEGEDIAFVGDFEHGMCELFEARKRGCAVRHIT